MLGPLALSGESIRHVAWRLCEFFHPLIRYINGLVSFVWVGFVSMMGEWDFEGWALVVSKGVVRTC
jgi:hypothetical protein